MGSSYTDKPRPALYEKDIQTPLNGLQPSPLTIRCTEWGPGLPFGRETVPMVQGIGVAITPFPGRWYGLRGVECAFTLYVGLAGRHIVSFSTNPYLVRTPPQSSANPSGNPQKTASSSPLVAGKAPSKEKDRKYNRRAAQTEMASSSSSPAPPFELSSSSPFSS